MKHLHPVSRVTVRQAMSTGEILSLVATILSVVGGLLAVIGTAVGGK